MNRMNPVTCGTVFHGSWCVVILKPSQATAVLVPLLRSDRWILNAGSSSS